MGFLGLRDKFASVKSPITAGDSWEINAAKDYVSSMTQSLRSTSDQQDAALRKVTDLSKSLSKMEAKLARLNRAEADNKELTARAADLDSKLSQMSGQARDLEGQLNAANRQLKSAQEELLSLRSGAAAAKDIEGKSETRIAALNSQMVELTQTVARLKRRERELIGRNRTLEEERSQTQIELSSQKRSVAELSQKLDEIAGSSDVTRRDYDAALVELSALKLSFDDVNTSYIDAQAELGKAEFEANSAQRQYGDSLSRREQDILSLKNRIEHLDAQLRIKDSARVQSERDITELQHSVRLANLRAEQAEMFSREIARESEDSASSVLRSQSEYDALNEKFMAALDDISMLQKLSQIQKEKLMRYAAVDGTPALNTSEAVSVDDTDYVAAAPSPQPNSAENIRILRRVKPAS